MNYTTIEAKTYEEAVKIARQKYGENLRILSRRDKQKKGFLGLGLSTSCEIVCFGANSADENEKQEEKKEDFLLKTFEQEAKTPNPRNIPIIERAVEKPVVEVVENTEKTDELLSYAQSLLKGNDFSENYIEKRLEELKIQLQKALPTVPSKKEIEINLFDQILGSVEFDYKNRTAPAGPLVFFGQEACGKTTVMAKVAVHYSKQFFEEERKTVSLLSLFPKSGEDRQLTQLANALNVNVTTCNEENEFKKTVEELSEGNLILIDAENSSRLKSAFDSGNFSNFIFTLVVPATMKYSDLILFADRFKAFKISSLIVSMADLTGTIGNILSFSSEKKIPMLFYTDGNQIPKDFKIANASFIASKLKGFSVDLNQILQV